MKQKPQVGDLVLITGICKQTERSYSNKSYIKDKVKCQIGKIGQVQDIFKIPRSPQYYVVIKGHSSQYWSLKDLEVVYAT